MKGTDHTNYREWLDLEVEGALAPGDRDRLAAHLVDCADCRAERQHLVVLREMLAGSRVDVAPGFRQEVMASLPEARWERRIASPRRWLAAGALATVLATLTTALFAMSGARLASGGSLAAALAAVGELLATAAIVGAGLLGASWSGVGLVVGDLFRRSPGTLAAVVLLALFLAALTISLLRRPRAAAERPVDR